MWMKKDKKLMNAALNEWKSHPLPMNGTLKMDTLVVCVSFKFWVRAIVWFIGTNNFRTFSLSFHV